MAGKLFESISIATIGVFFSLILLRFVAMSLDQILLTYQEIGIFDVNAQWQSSPQTLIDLFYIAAMLPAVLGIILAIMRSQMKTEAQLQTGFTEDEFAIQGYE